MDARPIASIRRRGSAESLPDVIEHPQHIAVSGYLERAADAAFSWRDANGLEQFNFPQLVWLYPDVAMRATPRYSRAAEVLSVNILSLVLMERDYPAWIGITSRRAVRLAKPFFDECLSNLPQDGWRIPLETLRDWIASGPLEDVPR